MTYEEIQQQLGIENKYSKWYLGIIKNAHEEVRIYDSKKYEHHHVLPKSIYPSFKELNENSWNGVYLTFREHFICHILIWKYFKTTKHTKNIFRMSKAIQSMNSWGKYNSKFYENNKQQLSMNMRTHLAKEWLVEELKSKNISSISNINNISISNIRYHINLYELEYIPNQQVYITEEWLKENLKNKTTSQIEDESKIRGETILAKAVKLNIPTPNKNKQKIIDINWLQEELKTKSLSEIIDDGKYKYDILMDRIKSNNLIIYKQTRTYRTSRSDKDKEKINIDIEWLMEKLKHLAPSQISNEYNYSINTIRNRIKKYDLIVHVKYPRNRRRRIS